jgi:cytochrome d ubiquinol oxidase subunit I
MHFFSTCMVALGSIFSSFWIVIANSWQQTPAGHHIVPILRDGEPWVIGGEVMRRAEILDFWAMVMNPSTVHRLTHVLLGCFVMGAFFVMSISAWYLLKRRHEEFARRSFRGALVLATAASWALLVSGHFQANNVYRTQPAKLAAFEGHFRTGPADMAIVGLPGDEGMKWEMGIPGGLSFLLHEDFGAEVVGLDRFRPEDRPPVAIPFVSYHLMIGIGMAFLGLTTLGCVLLRGGRLFRTRWLLWAFVAAVVPAVLANQAGWVAAEVGRQPWIVHPPVEWTDAGELVTGPDGLVVYDEGAGLRTTDAVSQAVRAEQVLASLILFGAIYALLGVLWLFILDRKIKHGPEPPETMGKRGARGFLEVAQERPAHAGGAGGPAGGDGS